MRKKNRNLITAGLFFSILTGMLACEKEQKSTDNDAYVNILKVAGDGTTSVIQNNLEAVLMVTPAISDDELSILLEMKEEEKLARDVYMFLYQKWDSQIFGNISKAEERHMNAVILLLKYYGSADTLVGDAGVFTMEEFSILYDNLTAAGSVSLEEAYKAGALIEEMDIKDLIEALNLVTNNNIILVFENLLKGSRNHLRAFVRKLTSLDITYSPVYLSEDEFMQIINSPMEKGNQYRRNGQEQHGKQGRNGRQG